VEYFGCDLISDQDNDIIELPYRTFGYRACVILTELCDSTLQEQLEGRYTIKPLVNDSIFLDILYGVNYLHDSGFIHRDLKPKNILVKFENGKNVYKITDFGLGKFVDVRSRAMVSAPRGTPFYRAPEQISGKTITTKVDIFSLGIILAELYTLKLIREWDPFQRLKQNFLNEDSSDEDEDMKWRIDKMMDRMMYFHMRDKEYRHKIYRRNWKKEINWELPDWLDDLFVRNLLNLPDNIKILVSQMTDKNPESRQDCKVLIGYFENMIPSNE
jgi:serine/threonine protein kinase